MTQPTPLIVVTSGEPAGIGPDICAMLAADNLPARLLTLGDPGVLQARIHELGLDVSVKVVGNSSDAGIHTPGTLQVLPTDTAKPVRPGHLDPGNADYVLRLLDAGTEICAGEAGVALVTAPIQKSIINEAGIAFSGHTEWLAERTGAQKPVMMLASAQLRVALATTHLPLKAVPQAITRDSLEQVLRVLDRELRTRFALDSPRITVLGLNPHAGESGTLGREEREIIEPVIAELCEQGLSLAGPIPADTAFTRERLEQCDAVLAMYHDQGLPVIKALAFGAVVNVTLGLPMIRTSVDHGTALDLAGTGRARPDSLKQAVQLALELASQSL